MRSRRPTKQRLWLGSGRYSCCGGRRYTDADAHCYSDGYRYANGNAHRNGDSIGNSHTETDANAQVRAFSEAAPHASSQALASILPENPRLVRW